MIEKQQLSCPTVLGKHAEISAVRGERRAEREALAWLVGGAAAHGLGSVYNIELRRLWVLLAAAMLGAAEQPASAKRDPEA